MRQIWSYLIVVFCACVTSARVLDYPGNRYGLQDNLFSTVKKEKVLTPPSDSGLIIDSNGYPGNSNGKAGASRSFPGFSSNYLNNLPKEPKIEEVNPKDLPPFFDKILENVLSNQADDYTIIPFTKEDIIQLENSEICRNIHMKGI